MLRIIRIAAVTLLLTAVFSAVSTGDDYKYSVTIDKEGIKSFRLAIGEHYKAPEKSITLCKKRGIPDEELPVVYFLAARSGVTPQELIDLRLKGRSWSHITFYIGLGADIYYVHLANPPSPPFGRAYGYFENTPKKKWRSIDLPDVDIINFVNLQFMSKHYGLTPDEVIKIRTKGKNFISVNGEAKKLKLAKLKDKESKAKKLRPMKASIPIKIKSGGYPKKTKK